MAEIALRTTERKTQTATRLSWRPVGSTIVCCSDSIIRRKWLEICCDLVSPKKRDNFRGIPGWRELCEAWTQDLRAAWIEYDRPTIAYPLGQLLMDKSYPQVVWHEIIEPLGMLADLPFAPESDVRVHDTWLWSDDERKRYYIVINTDADSETIESWQGVEERDADTGEVLPELGEGEIRDPQIKIAIVWAKQIRYLTDLGLTGGTLGDIANTDKVLHPKFDSPVAKLKAVRPDIADARSVEAI